MLHKCVLDCFSFAMKTFYWEHRIEEYKNLKNYGNIEHVRFGP
jgi:hypothetical protein